MGLLFTFIIGLFILLGSVIVFLLKNNNKFIHFCMSLSLGVIVMLIALELLPEVLELFGENYNSNITIMMTIGFTGLGILILKLIDLFIPHHHNHKEDNHENLYHVGIVSAIALILHNIIEGMAVYGSVESSFSLGLLVSIGVGLHNIPLGMLITSTIYKSGKNLKHTLFIVALISLSSFVGGIIMFFNNTLLLNATILGILLSITQGMLIYIMIFELLPHLLHEKNKFRVVLGVIIGVLLFFGSTFLE